MMAWLHQHHAAPIVLSESDLLAHMRERPRMMWLIGMAERLGVRAFMVYTEFIDYPPGTGENDKFEFISADWQSIKWMVVGVPKQDQARLRSIARACGLRIADGTPLMISSAGKEWFPMRGNNCFTLENRPNHPFYKADPSQQRAMYMAEHRVVNRVLDEGWRPSLTELAAALEPPAVPAN